MRIGPPNPLSYFVPSNVVVCSTVVADQQQNTPAHNLVNAQRYLILKTEDWVSLTLPSEHCQGWFDQWLSSTD